MRADLHRHRELGELVPEKTPWFGVVALLVMLTFVMLFGVLFFARFYL